MNASVSMVIACCVLTVSACLAKRVIFMPLIIPSHCYNHISLARAMLVRGHEVWLVLPDSVTTRGVTNTSGMTIIHYHTTYDHQDDVSRELIQKAFFAEEPTRMSEVFKISHSISHEILSNQSLYEQMKSVQADLFVFDDDRYMAKMFVIFPYRLGIPFACIDVTFQPFNRRVPFSPATVPAFLSAYGQNMTVWERAQNTLNFISEWMDNPYVYQDVVARYAPEMPYIPLDRLVARSEVWLIGLDPILHFPYPTVPNVKHIGGLAASPAKPLDPVFQSFMDSGKEGVIVGSFGSLVFSMPQGITDKLMAAFQRMHPLKVVFRLNVTSPDPSQILTSSWLPQNSLLAHPNCRVLVTHCGLNGEYQALYHAVPMLGLPVFYDQHQNAYNMERKGYGIKMDIRKASVEDLVRALKDLTEGGRHRDTITSASRLFREQYGVPLHTAAYWLDHVMQHGGHYMRSAGQDMALYQFLMLDVMLVLAGCVSVLLVLVCLCARCLCATLCKAKASRKKKD